MTNDDLIEIARKAAKNSYSPYSNYSVGAAALTAEGEVFIGTNIENSSYDMTECAEGLAVKAAISNGYKNITKVAISLPNGDINKPETLMPCGGCRQVMSEFMDPEALIIIDQVGVFSLKDLLPNPFSIKNHLNR